MRYRKTERALIHLFTNKMPAVTGTRPGEIREPGIQSRPCRWLTGTHLLEPSLQLPRIHSSRDLELRTESGYNPRFPDMKSGQWPLHNCDRKIQQKTSKLHNNVQLNITLIFEKYCETVCVYSR